MAEETRQAFAILAFIFLCPLMMIVTFDNAEALHFEVREVEESKEQ